MHNDRDLIAATYHDHFTALSQHPENKSWARIGQAVALASSAQQSQMRRRTGEDRTANWLLVVGRGFVGWRFGGQASCMDQSTPSRTSDIPAVMRALHQTRDGEPKILADPVAARLIDLNALDPKWIEPILNHPFASQWRAGFTIRSRYTEDSLAEAVAGGVRQYLILGAGLDTFCYRQPAWAQAIHIFEVDHPATQSSILTKLAKIGIVPPPNLTFAPIDFETTSLREALRATKFAFDTKTFCSWLGVAQYLTGEAIRRTLNFVLSLPAGSEIVLSFVLPQAALSGLEADAMMTAAARSAEAGEPWISRFCPGEIELLLRHRGFSKVVHFSPEEIHARYLKDRSDGLTGRRGEQLIRAIV